MAYPAPKPARFTWTDYQSWPEDQRWELIEGEAFSMSPSPGSRHQRVCGRLYAALERHFENQQDCQVFVAPMDVKLSEADVVQPDILVVCDPRQIQRTHIEGAPSLVVEVISPSSVMHDRLRKPRLYARCGVPELWLVTPFPHMVEVLRLDGASYRTVAGYTKQDQLVSATFPDLRIALDQVFDFPLDPDEQPQVREQPAHYRRAD